MIGDLLDGSQVLGHRCFTVCTHAPDQIRLKKHPGVIGDLELVDNPQGSQNDLGTISEGSQTQKGVRRVL